jgi:prefoldin beta subunit
LISVAPNKKLYKIIIQRLIMVEELSDEAKELLLQFQSYQQQLQNILIQKETLKLQEIEVEKALEELNATKQTSAYKIVGNIMLSKSVEDLKKELNESKEELSLRIKSIESVELKIKDKLKELQNKLKDIIKE